MVKTRMLSHGPKKRGSNIENAYWFLACTTYLVLKLSCIVYCRLLSVSFASLTFFLKAGNMLFLLYKCRSVHNISLHGVCNYLQIHLLFLSLFYWSEKGRDLLNTKHLETPGIMRCKHPTSSIGIYYIYYILKNVPFHFSLEKWNLEFIYKKE